MSIVPGTLKTATNGIELEIIITKITVENLPEYTDERIHTTKVSRSSLEEKKRWRGEYHSKRRKLVAPKEFTFTDHLLCAGLYTSGQKTTAPGPNPDYRLFL